MMLNLFYRYHASELANDVRSEYIDLLRRGHEGVEATEKLIDDFASVLHDEDDAPVFWFVLADLQWDCGRLEETVKYNAVLHIDRLLEDYTTQINGNKSSGKLINELADFKKKLLSPLPQKKQIKQYRLYHTDWKIGDVFAYSLDGIGAGYPEFHRMYMYFVVKGTELWHPGHTIPVVYVFLGASKELLSLDRIQEKEYRPQFYTPIAYRNSPEMKRKYSLALLCTSARVIPKMKLKYLGNIETIRILDCEDPTAYHVAWNKLDRYLIENYIAWEHTSITDR